MEIDLTRIVYVERPPRLHWGVSKSQNHEYSSSSSCPSVPMLNSKVEEGAITIIVQVQPTTTPLRENIGFDELLIHLRNGCECLSST